jgi:class 3 adenylate cyclase
MGLLGDLIVSPVPEPITPEAWRRLARLMVGIHLCLMAANALSMLLAPLDPELHLRAVYRYATVNLLAHAIAIAAFVLLLRRARTPARLRAIFLFAASLQLLTVITSQALAGSVTSWNFLWFLIVIGGYRIYLDAPFARWVLALALVEYFALVALEVGGVLTPQAAMPHVQSLHYKTAAHHLIGAGWIGLILAVSYVCANYIALRIRSTEHAMRELNLNLEARVREQLTQLERASRLRRYLSPQVAERLLASAVDPVAARERRPVTVMFADLKSFTPMVERLPPDALSSVLTRYFTEVADIAFRHGGTIDKFIGDAVMVFFGAPESTGESDQAIRCVRMALEVQRRMGELGPAFIALGAEAPLEVRVGIGSGLATVGEFGAKHRTDYTVVGAPVNRAARLESLCPPGGVLVDRTTFELLGDRAHATPHGEVTLKGFSKAEPVYLVDRLGKLPTLRDVGR